MLWYRTAKHAENLIGRFRLLSTGGSLADTVGVQNPFRYRSYYYDNETGLYYLQSRYYNPELSRFISADDPKSHQDYSNLISANLYSYANDNPVLYADPDGKATSTPYPGYYIEYNTHVYDKNVLLVQKQLRDVFQYTLDVDGYFGPVTKADVMDFQSKHPQCGGADGIVGPNTWAVLFASNNTPTTPVSPTVNPPVKDPTVPYGPKICIEDQKYTGIWTRGKRSAGGHRSRSADR